MTWAQLTGASDGEAGEATGARDGGARARGGRGVGDGGAGAGCARACAYLPLCPCEFVFADMNKQFA